ncbi:MAG: hypothetical protein IT422_30250 [Pirellulaceae bacterium]|jgi:uncharacterized protein YkwD|nr:hypothetical protein [Pirellulaceae bacterium]
MCRFLLSLAVLTLTLPLHANELRSTSWDVAIDITWQNESSSPVDLYWVDYDGVEQFATAIPPGGNTGGTSYATHVFVFKQNGRVVSQFQLQDYPRKQTHVVASDREINRVDDLASQILQYVNAERAAAGLAPMTMLPVLNQFATQHSQSMANGAVPFGHDSFNARIQSAAQTAGEAFRGGAENVAYRFDRDAKAVVEQWMNSPGHRANILGSFSKIGIGVATKSDGAVYFTQMFLL